ncbi:MAG: PQQ-dependent sugar dehydrogenase, partial [Spirulinaceae cyanobacterium]
MGCTAQTQPGATVTETGETTPIEATTAADEADFQMVTVLENLEHPWGLAWLPDGELLITERPGRLRIAREGVLDPTPIPGLPEIFAQGQGGLLDIALHPDFAENRLVYFSYAHGDSSANRTRIARATFDGETLNDWEVIFEVSQPKSRAQHFGSRLAWLPDGTLLVSIGDGGNPPTAIDGEFIRQQAQNRSSHLGKVLRLHDDGSIPADNPFVEDTEAAPEIWSYGHRNIQGLAIDPETEQVWAT